MDTPKEIYILLLLLAIGGAMLAGIGISRARTNVDAKEAQQETEEQTQQTPKQALTSYFEEQDIVVENIENITINVNDSFNDNSTTTKTDVNVSLF